MPPRDAWHVRWGRTKQARRRRKQHKHLAAQWAGRRHQPDPVVRKTAAALLKLGAHDGAEAARRREELALLFLAARRSCKENSPEAAACLEGALDMISGCLEGALDATSGGNQQQEEQEQEQQVQQQQQQEQQEQQQQQQ